MPRYIVYRKPTYLIIGTIIKGFFGSLIAAGWSVFDSTGLDTVWMVLRISMENFQNSKKSNPNRLDSSGF